MAMRGAARRRTGPTVSTTAPPDDLLGPGRTIPGHDTDEARARHAALLRWLDERGLIAHGLPPFAPGLIDPIDDLLLAPVHRPGETWDEFAARVAAEDLPATSSKGTP